MQTNSSTQIIAKKLPWIIPIYCDGCMSCINRCNKCLLKMVETNIEGVFVPWLDEPEKCGGCGKCAQDCAMGAITMTSYVDRAFARFQVKPALPQLD